jgi:hypothetical protein
MKLLRTIISVIALVFLFSGQSQAKSVCMPKIYLFGVSISFNDSTVYFTDIQQLENAWVINKSKMLEGRSDYANQFKSYFSGLGEKERTCVVYYAFTEKAIQKKLAIIRKRFTNPKKRKYEHYEIKTVARDLFVFQQVTHQDDTDEPVMSKEERKVAEKAAKQAVKDKRRAEAQAAQEAKRKKKEEQKAAKAS